MIVNGKIVHEQAVPAGQGRGAWITIDRPLELDRSSWIAARAFSKAPSGAPDAEAHTNPVYVYLGNKSPYNRDSLDRLVARIDGQIAAHRKRSFDEKARVLDDFQRSRDILMRVRRDGGSTGRRHPRGLARRRSRGVRCQPPDSFRSSAWQFPPGRTIAHDR